MDLISYSIKAFVDETASSSPAPGGGSISALAGGLAAALGQMVIRLTVGKKVFLALPEQTQQGFSEKLAVLESAASKLLSLIDEDTNAFNSFMAALKLPKTTEEEKHHRRSAMQDAAILSMNVPLNTAQTCLSVLQALPTIAEYGNKNAASDAGVAALLARAAVEGAILNVKINVSGIDDAALAAKTNRECEALLTQAEELKKSVLEIVYAAL